MSRFSWLLWRRHRALWAVPVGAVKAISQAGTPEIQLAKGVLPADEVLGVVSNLVPRPAGEVLAAFWPFACAGLAVFQGQALVMLEPGAPPPPLCKGEI